MVNLVRADYTPRFLGSLQRGLVGLVSEDTGQHLC
jgi:hypothetical protein